MSNIEHNQSINIPASLTSVYLGGESVVVGGGGGGTVAKRARITNEEKIAKINETIKLEDRAFNKLVKSNIRYNEKIVQSDIVIANELEELAELQALVKQKEDRIHAQRLRIRSIRQRIDKNIHKNSTWYTLFQNHQRGPRAELVRDVHLLTTKSNIAKWKKEATQFANENKKKTPKTILAKIAMLSDDLIGCIREFIPYDVRIALIEDRYKPMKTLIPRLDLHGISMLIKHFYLTPAFFSYLSIEEARQHTYGCRAYNPAWTHGSRVDMVTQLMRPIIEMKCKNPEIAYKFLSTIAITIKPDRMYHGIYV